MQGRSGCTRCRAAPFTAALGVTRRVDAMSLVTFEGRQYSVPHALARQAVYVRRDDGQVVITHAEAGGPAEVARHLVTAPGSPRVQDTHYPPAPPGALNRTATPRTAAEEQFLGIGEAPGLWLAETAAAGASRIRAKMAGAVQLAALHGAAATDRALGQAAAAGRFADGDLAAIIAHQAAAAGGEPSPAGGCCQHPHGRGPRGRGGLVVDIWSDGVGRPGLPGTQPAELSIRSYWEGTGVPLKPWRLPHSRFV
jgi:hypothetical protein